MDIYQATLTDHYRNPRNRGTLEKPDFSSEQYNPSCGDLISWQGILGADGLLKQVVFQGKGCVISQGTASLLSVALVDQSMEYVKALDSSFVLTIIKLELGPTRLRCALLPLEALKQGLNTYQLSVKAQHEE